jgi:hypothetical protein
MNSDVTEISELGKRWCAAEVTGDTAAMGSLAHMVSCSSDRWASSWTRPVETLTSPSIDIR